MASRSPDPEVGLFLVVVGEDHPKACTGRKLLRAEWVGAARADRRPPSDPVLLDPRDDRPLSAADRPRALSGGLLGVDCSWNRLHSRGGYPRLGGWMDRVRDRRRLPFLLAGNPQHFGRLGELNTAEAFAASLWVLGEPARARRLLEGFAGGEAFFALNHDPLASYAAAQDAEEVRAAEREYF